MTDTRQLVSQCLDFPSILDSIGDADDFVSSGVNSGEVIRIALRCEEELGRALSDEELASLNTLAAVRELLAGGAA
ncbi:MULTISPECIES: acyl carrier protein [unclassified Streptomyces]|uniref:Acyl carrier protein n=1 Tax=Streptomyces sp. NBC_00060 TaxID=2975636 RepID=A0AAU2HBE4_9ACTN